MNSSRSLSRALKVLGRNMDISSQHSGTAERRRRGLGDHRTRSAEAATVQLFDFQWLSRIVARSRFLLFTQTIRLVQAAAKRN